jgi:predicted AAA+ superfamily ATPase
MFSRRALLPLRLLLAEFPAVAILGPRQVGKTTLAMTLAEMLPASTYADLESPADSSKLADMTGYFEAHRDETKYNAPHVCSRIYVELSTNADGRDSASASSCC